MERPSDVERLLADLAQWMADERAGEAASGRSKERWLRQAATEGARLSGVALDLAERGASVAVRTVLGRVVRGVIVAVAEDFWVLDGPARTTFVAVDAVTTVRSQPDGTSGARGSGGGDATGDRVDVLDMRFGDALAALAGSRPEVRLALVGDSDLLVGELRAVGADLLTLRVEGVPAASVYVALSCVTECSIFGSG